MLIWQLHCRSVACWQKWCLRWKLWYRWKHWFESSSCQALLSHVHFIAALNSVRFSAHELMLWESWLDFLAATELACWISWVFWTDKLDHTFLMQKMFYSDKFSSYISHACFWEFSSFSQWFVHRLAVWYHSWRHSCSVDCWCCCKSSEALLCRTDREWEIEKISVTLQQILILLLSQCLTALELRFCLSWRLLLISQAALKFSWLITHASFCCTSLNHRFLWCLETEVRLHDLHLIRSHELD